MTERELNRATLARQLLLRRKRLDAVEGVRRVTALQAQTAASPYIALWNRLAAFDPAQLDAAFANGTVVKASLIRITLHAVHADDYPAFHTAMQYPLRASRLHDRRFTDTGLTKADAEALLPRALEFAAVPRTNPECEAFCEEPRAWWALRTFAPLHHAPTGGPWSFGHHPSYVAAPPYEPPEAPFAYFARRYLEAFGPATAADFAQFSMLSRAVAREALSGLEVAGGLYDVPDAPRPPADTPAPPRLLGMWDSVLLAYFDRSRVVPEPFRRVVIRQNGDVLPTLLVDGYVAGVWRPVEDGIECTAFRPLSAEDWDGLAREAARLVRLLADRDPAVYKRYFHWWAKLPDGDVRVLPQASGKNSIP